MLTARMVRNPPRMYLAALLPLCKKRIMLGNLQGNNGDKHHYGLAPLYRGFCMIGPSGDRVNGPSDHWIIGESPLATKLSRHRFSDHPITGSPDHPIT